MTIVSTTFTSITALSNAGIAKIDQTASVSLPMFDISIKSTTFTAINSKSNGGGFYISNPSLRYFITEDINIKQVTALLNGGVFYITMMTG